MSTFGCLHLCRTIMGTLYTPAINLAQLLVSPVDPILVVTTTLLTRHK
jgi:hypothetical protein